MTSPKHKKRIIEGNDNEVYDVETAQGSVIVRIHRFGEVGYKEEAWALEQCQKQGVPVPEVLLRDTVELDGTTYDAMVQNKLRGKDFRKVIHAGIPQNDLQKVLFQAGEFLKRMHEIKVNGFYRLNGDGQWDFRSWENVLEASIRDRKSEMAYIMSTGFTDDEFSDMLRLHHTYKDHYPCREPVLCHGDYTPEHWFVDENLEITGIIDFGDMQGGSEILDLAMFEFNEPEIDSTAFFKGYGIHDPDNREFQKKLNLQKLVLQTGYLAHFVRQQNAEEVKATVPLLRKTLRVLKRF